MTRSSAPGGVFLQVAISAAGRGQEHQRHAAELVAAAFARARNVQVRLPSLSSCELHGDVRDRGGVLVQEGAEL